MTKYITGCSALYHSNFVIAFCTGRVICCTVMFPGRSWLFVSCWAPGTCPTSTSTTSASSTINSSTCELCARHMSPPTINSSTCLPSLNVTLPVLIKCHPIRINQPASARQNLQQCSAHELDSTASSKVIINSVRSSSFSMCSIFFNFYFAQRHSVALGDNPFFT